MSLSKHSQWPNWQIKSNALQGAESFWSLLVLIVMVALVLRLLFPSGQVRNDSTLYAQAAFELSQGRLHLDYLPEVTTRIGLYGPIALLYRLGGVHDWTTMAYSMLCSLLSVVFLSLLGRETGGNRIGLLAGLLWAVFPLEIHQSTILRPDAPMASFCVISFYFYVKAYNTPTKKRLYYFLCAIALLWAVLIKPIAIVTGFFYLATIGSHLTNNLLCGKGRVQYNTGKIFKVGVVILLVAGSLIMVSLPRDVLIGDFSRLARAASDATELVFLGIQNTESHRSVRNIVFGIVPYLFLLSLYRTGTKMNAQVKIILASIAFQFFYYEWGSFGSRGLWYVPLFDFNDARLILFVFPPVFIVISFYIDSLFANKKQVYILIMLSGTIALLAGLMFRDSIYQNNTVASIILLSGTFLAISGLLRAFLSQPMQSIPSWAASLTLVGLVISMLATASPENSFYTRTQRSYVQSVSEVAKKLEELSGPIYVRSVGDATLLNMVSNFSLGYSWPPNSVEKTNARIMVGKPVDDSQKYILINYGVRVAGTNLEMIGKFENDLTDLYLYRNKDED